MSTPSQISHEHPGHLYPQLCDQAVLENSWRRVLAHYGHSKRPEEVEQFERDRESHIHRLAEELRRERYSPEPAALLSIDKPQHPGERRTIALLRAQDRLVLTALDYLLEPILSRDFESGSFAYRHGLGASAAIHRVQQFLSLHWNWAAGGDIDNFFDSMLRERLLAMLRRRIWEPPVLRLLEIYLLMGRHQGTRWVDSGRGIAQGSPLSPLLSNLYLSPLDHALRAWSEQSGEPARGGWLRYADNLLVLAESRELAESGFSVGSRVVRDDLDLQWNSDSLFVRSDAEGFAFLGFWFLEGKARISAAKFAEMQKTIEERLRSSSGDPMAGLESLSETVEGWKRYYHSGQTKDQFAQLDEALGRALAAWLGEERKRPDQPSRKSWEEWLGRLERPVEDGPQERRRWVAALMEGRIPDTSSSAADVPRGGAPSPPGEQEGKRPKPLTPQQVVGRRKRECEARQREIADFLVTEPGTFLGIHGQHLYARREGHKVAEAPLAGVRHITLLEYAGALSGDLMVEAAKRGIVIDILGRDGKPLARVSPPEAPAFDTSSAQLRLAGTPAALYVASRIVEGKIRNQRALLKYFSKFRARANADFLRAARQANEAMREIMREVASRRYADGADVTLERDRLFAAEGQAATHYWQALEALLRGIPGFTGRVRRGATDLVNELLNYGYGILYGRLLGVLTRAGLNPNISFLHAPQPGKPTLLFDFIEEFRAPAVDRVVCSRLGMGVRFTLDDEGLSIDTRRRLAREVINRLHAPVRYRGKVMPLLAVMDRQADLLVQHILGKDQYRSFPLPW